MCWIAVFSPRRLNHWGAKTTCCSWLVLAAALFSVNVHASDPLVISTARSDPSEICHVLANNLPKRIELIRKVGKLIREKKTHTDDFECNERAGGCEAHVLQFQRLELGVLTSPSFDAPWLMEAVISSANWTLFGDIRVGQALTVAEGHFGVAIPRESSPVKLVGECTPLTIWHRKGYITKVTLDCQACY